MSNQTEEKTESSRFANPIRLHLTRVVVGVNDYGYSVATTVDAFAVGNRIEGFGARHRYRMRGYVLIAKYEGEVWEIHQNKNTDFFKVLNRKENRSVRREIWAPNQSERWFSDKIWIALSELSYR